MRFLILFLVALCLHSNLNADTIYEAEDAKLKGVEFSDQIKGYSGRGYVTKFLDTGDSVSFQVKVDSSGLYDLFCSYSTDTEKSNRLIVNDSDQGNMKFPGSIKFTEIKVGKVSLKKGINDVTVLKDWGYFNLDYIRIKKAEKSIPFNISPKLNNPNPSKEAVALYAYLNDIYGKKIISGQQDYENFKSFESLTNGKLPAVLGLDFIFYNPFDSDWSKSVDKAIDWCNNKNGIVTFAWHWFAPKKDKEDKTDFYTKKTDFDANKIFDKNSIEYRMMLRDMDFIAGKIKILRDANVPILWRPFHEAQGKWFWWGAKGPEPCMELYKIMYDRFTNTHKLNNLIWVWTAMDEPEAMKWYPGDEYVDIIGNDVYLSSLNYTSSITCFENLRETYKGKKIIAMSENGTTPDPDKLIEDNAHWSWFVTWCNMVENPKHNNKKMLENTYNHDYVITLDELPDWKNYPLSKE